MVLRHLLYRIIACVLLLFLTPCFLLLYILVKTDSPGPFFFVQKRLGKDKKPFLLYKIRTMHVDAERVRKKYLRLNEVDGPVFKIRDDPRYTRVGKRLSHLGIDEIPQLINVVRGEMSLVGPRPLPVYEARRIPSQYKVRFSVLPGMTSEWVIRGSHKLSFSTWMKLDLAYVKQNSLSGDLRIFFKTVQGLISQIS